MNNNLTLWRQALALHNIPPKKGTKMHDCVHRTFEQLQRGKVVKPKLEPSHCPRSTPRAPPVLPASPPKKQRKPRLPPKMKVVSLSEVLVEEGGESSSDYDDFLASEDSLEQKYQALAVNEVRRMVRQKEGPFAVVPKNMFEERVMIVGPVPEVVHVPMVRRVAK